MVEGESQLQQILPLMKTHLRAHTRTLWCANVCTHMQINVVYKKQREALTLGRVGVGGMRTALRGR